MAKPRGAIHSTKISGNFGPKLNGSVRSNRKSFEKTGPPFEVVLFSRSDRLEFWLNGSRPSICIHPEIPVCLVSFAASHLEEMLRDILKDGYRVFGRFFFRVIGFLGSAAFTSTFHFLSCSFGCCATGSCWFAPFTRTVHQLLLPIFACVTCNHR